MLVKMNWVGSLIVILSARMVNRQRFQYGKKYFINIKNIYIIYVYFSFNIYYIQFVSNIYTQKFYIKTSPQQIHWQPGFLSQQYDADVETETLMASGGASMGIDLAMRSFATEGQVARWWLQSGGLGWFYQTRSPKT